MQLPFFYEPLLIEDVSIFILSAESHKHAVQVLRMRVADALHLTNGKGLMCRAVIKEVNKKQTIILIQSVQFFEPAPLQITIGISLLKNTTRLEWFLEKATEIGINEIILLQCTRTEKQHFRLDRLQAILISAMLQSQQNWLPILHEPKPLKTILQNAEQPIKLIGHCEETTKAELNTIKIDSNTLLLIGPEGDFTTEEISIANSNNFIAVSLGKTRLRTETAGVVAASILMLR